jgi:hypothetical protein
MSTTTNEGHRHYVPQNLKKIIINKSLHPSWYGGGATLVMRENAGPSGRGDRIATAIETMAEPASVNDLPFNLEPVQAEL